ncbi:MAG: hypothetical protein CL943_00245 [Candidatus Diapherotrites archaeon]|uniref:Glycosyltransferase family 39 protein n=1 Tax=Candidatus Iainarchaeum sp. TaxID=3101447 RepID=A0A2D6LZX2_9ARCH|nr:hypothetical protein [Candidatus Diapherotrites archaeon]
MKNSNTLVLVAILALAVYTIVSSNPALIPTHMDEYDHLAIAKESVSEQKIVFYNPFLDSKPPQSFFHSRFESSFDVLLALLLIMLPIESVDLAVPFVLFVSSLISLAAFVFARKIFNNRLAALIMAASVFFIENNFAFLGYAFMVPMSLASAMLLAMAYLFIKSLDSNKYCILFLAVMISTIFIHPIFSFMAVAAAAGFVIVRPGILVAHKGKTLIAGIIMVGGALAVELFTKYSLAELFFWPYDTYTKNFPLLEFVTVPILVLAIVGAMAIAWAIIKKQFSKEQENYAGFLIAATLVGLLIRLYADATQVCLLGPCRRTTSAFALFLFVLAGAGIYAMLSRALAELKSLSPSAIRIGFGALALVLVLGLITGLEYTSFKNFHEVADKYAIPDTQAIKTMKWLSQNTEKGDNILALPWHGKGIFIVANRTVTPTIATRMGTFSTSTAMELGYDDLLDFFNLNCEGKYKVLDKYNAEFMFSTEERVDCPKINKIYQGSANNHSVYAGEKSI